MTDLKALLAVLVLVQGVLPERVLGVGRVRAHHLTGPLLLDGGQGERLVVHVTDVGSLKVRGNSPLLHLKVLSILEAEEGRRAGDTPHAVVGHAGVGPQAAGAVLA